MFKKLMEINYNNKRFLILMDNNYRKTFLEINEDGNYVYPEYVDYKNLNEIYNNYDYLIKYNDNSKYMTYREKVRYKSVLLLVSTILAAEVGYIGKMVYDLDEVDKKTLSIGFQRIYKDENHNRNDIDVFYDNEVITKEDVVNVINNNDNLSDYFKNIALEVLDLNIMLDHDINLRIYYENMKELKVIIEPWNVISKDNKENQAGYFSAVDKSIHLCDTYAYVDAIVAHEFTHAVHNILDSSKNEILYINETMGFSLEEAMTNRIVANKWGEQKTYDIQQRILSYYMDSVDGFDYHMYNEFGIMGLVYELKEKYPAVDIDYLINYIDTYTKTGYSLGSVQKQPYEDMDFCDELFKIAISNIDRNDMYKSFDIFIKMFDKYTDEDYYKKYSVLFNNYIKNNIESLVNTK